MDIRKVNYYSSGQIMILFKIYRLSGNLYEREFILKEGFDMLDSRDIHAKENSANIFQNDAVMSQAEIEQEVESLCRWAAGRAGVIVVAPLLGQIALAANEIYLIKRIANLYNVKFDEAASCAFVSALGGTFIGQSLATLIPFPPFQIPIGMGVTYAVGKTANAWIKDGMPDFADFKDKYKDIFEQAKEEAKSLIPILKKDPNRDKPLGDENKDFKF